MTVKKQADKKYKFGRSDSRERVVALFPTPKLTIKRKGKDLIVDDIRINILKSTYDEILKSNGIKVAPVVEVIDGKPVKRAGTKSASKTWKIIFEAGSRTVEGQPQKIYTSFSLVIPSYLGIIGYAEFIGSTFKSTVPLKHVSPHGFGYSHEVIKAIADEASTGDATPGT